MSNINDDQMYRSITVERVHVYARQYLSQFPGLAESAKFDVHASVIANQLVATITAWCMSGIIPSNEETETVSWPDGVWQTFKMNCLPQWFKRRFPVRMASRKITTVTNHYFVCPHLVSEDKSRHLQFMVTGTPQATWFK
jgi:hypothetical protein